VWGGQPPNDALSKAEAAATKATELDGTLSEGHTSLAFAKWIYDRDWAGAEREFQQAIKLRPGYPTAHHWYSYFLAAMGRFDEAITHIKLARDLDELSASINTDVGEIYCWARRYDQALEQLQEVLKSEPNFPPARNILGMTYIKLGRLSEGVAELEAARHLDGGPRVTAALGCAYGLAGRKSDAQRMIGELERMSRKRYVSPFARALICAGLGKRDEAFALLDETDKQHSDSIVILKVYPWVDNLRSDARFPKLLQRIGLQP
jgi:Flp pilus assembly protein TadD